MGYTQFLTEETANDVSQTKKAQDLSRVSIDLNNCEVVDIKFASTNTPSSGTTTAPLLTSSTLTEIVQGLEQGCLTVDSAQRFFFLFTFLKKS